MKFLAPTIILIVVAAALITTAIIGRAQTAPSESWRYDHDASGAVTIGDAILVLRHVGEVYDLPGPCHPFTAFATPVVLADGTTLDGFFGDDSIDPPSRDYLTC